MANLFDLLLARDSNWVLLRVCNSAIQWLGVIIITCRGFFYLLSSREETVLEILLTNIGSIKSVWHQEAVTESGTYLRAIGIVYSGQSQ